MIQKKNSGSGILILIAFLAVVGGLSYLAFTTPGVDDERSPRMAIALQLGAQLGIGEDERLAPAPWLNAEVFDVGAVFPMDGSFAMARSTACDDITTVSRKVGLSIGDNTTYAVKPDLHLESIGAGNVDTVRAVKYRVNISDALIAPGLEELLSEMYNDPDCLAVVANRDVMVLYGVYRGEEQYSMKRSVSGGFNVSVAIANIKENLGLSSSVDDSDTVLRPNATLYWALTKIRLDEPAFEFDENLKEEVRVAIAEDLVNAEAEYATRAIPNTAIDQPSTAEIEELVDAVAEVKQ